MLKKPDDDDVKVGIILFFRGYGCGVLVLK
jgi:hypothetical protein